MADPIGLMAFTGVQQIISGSYTLSHGISPGVATLEIVPQAQILTEDGELGFTFGNVGFKFTGCKIDQGSFVRNSGGAITRISVFDRRWKWRFNSISGVYNNKRDGDNFNPRQAGVYQRSRLKTAAELCAILLDAMGEVGYDVSQVPLLYPEVAWDHDNPAQALAELCDETGCRVVLTLQDRILIGRTGVGILLPDQDVLDGQITVNPPERPDSLTVVCGPTRYQATFPLQAVGLEVPRGKFRPQGQIKLINDLSYKPAQPVGWELESTIKFDNVEPGVALEASVARQLAFQSVWLWYRISAPLRKAFLPKGNIFPGFGKIESMAQFLPLDDKLAELIYNELGEVVDADKAIVFGRFYPGGLAGANNTTREQKGPVFNSKPDTMYPFPFTINKERGIVEFANRVYMHDPILLNLNIYEKRVAEIYLYTGVTIRRYKTWTYDRYERTLTFPGPLRGTGTRVLKHEDIVLEKFPIYDANTGQVKRIQTNQDEVNKQCDYYLAAAAAEYQTTNPVEVTYMGLKAISPDGAVQQVTWSVGPGGATTRVSRNNEFNPAVPPYRERRLFERLRGDVLKELKKKAEQKKKK